MTPEERTQAQLADVLQKDGERAKQAYTREHGWCGECGAIPGYRHDPACTTDKYPHL